MQTERVTFLTTPDHKAALDAFATSNGMSVGHVVREATSQFLAQPTSAEETRLRLLLDEVNDAVPQMNASFDHMIDTLDRTHATVDALLRDMGLRT